MNWDSRFLSSSAPKAQRSVAHGNALDCIGITSKTRLIWKLPLRISEEASKLCY